MFQLIPIALDQFTIKVKSQILKMKKMLKIITRNVKQVGKIFKWII